VIEHNLDVVKTADWIVDLGPEGGDGGGRLVAEGAPEAIAANPDSYTGRFLAEVLGRLPLDDPSTIRMGEEEPLEVGPLA
jgi:excinuclease ABC subunit A